MEGEVDSWEKKIKWKERYWGIGVEAIWRKKWRKDWIKKCRAMVGRMEQILKRHSITLEIDIKYC